LHVLVEGIERAGDLADQREIVEVQRRPPLEGAVIRRLWIGEGGEVAHPVR
jgi:hypothetical protein